MSTTTSDEERDRLYAMAREAQLRGIKPLAVQSEMNRTAAEPKQPNTKAAKKQKAAKPSQAKLESKAEEVEVID